MSRKRVSTTLESDSGRNLKFRDNYNNQNMTRTQFVNKIEKGNYENYHIREINGIKTPCSNPDKSTNNNLD